MKRDAAEDVSAIYNACWWVRRYQRGTRIESTSVYRRQAIQKLGLTCHEIFSRTHDFEPILAALVDGLRPQDPPPPF